MIYSNKLICCLYCAVPLFNINKYAQTSLKFVSFVKKTVAVKFQFKVSKFQTFIIRK